MTFTDSKERFSNRAADYLRYRPNYPAAVIELVRGECGLRPGHVVADVGSGTGLLSELFLKNGNRVYGVEPNEAMRQAGEEYLASFDGFTSVNGSAEATTLDDASVDFVAAGQAFHWFEPSATRRETTPFLHDYEALLREFGTDYARVSESYPRPEHMRNFFGRDVYREDDLPNAQDFDFEGLSGRTRSSSYMPAADHPKFAPMMAALEAIFRKHAQDGRVRMEYLTRLYFGRLDSHGDQI